MAREFESSPSVWAKQCGVCHAGGGQLEYDRDMLPYGQAGTTNEGDRYTWRPSRIEGGVIVAGSIVDISTNANRELAGSNNTEVDCMMCHMNELRVGAAWYKSINCGPANMVGPADNPTCDTSDPRFVFTPGAIYDSFNRNAAVSVGLFRQAASAGIGAKVDLTSGAITNNPSSIPAASIASVPNSANCAQCHARTEADNIGLPGEAQQYGGMITGYGNFFRISKPGEVIDLDRISSTGTCGADNCANLTTWNEFGCKTGMGKRSQKTGPGSSDRFGPGLCLMCDMLGKWNDPYAFCGIVAAQCAEKSGKSDLISDNNPYSLIDGTGRPMQIPGKMADIDVHEKSVLEYNPGQAIKCGTCHYGVSATAAKPIPARTVSATVGGQTYSYTYPANSDIQPVDHQMAQGWSMLEHANDQLDGLVTCESCHTTRTHPRLKENGGTLTSPNPTHSGFIALHIEKIDCRTCHIPTVYSSPGRLLFRDWTAGGYRQNEGSNGNANHFDFAYNFLDGSMVPMAPLKVWITTPEGTRIAPILPSLLPLWTGSALKDPTIIGADGVEVMGWSPSKTRDITKAVALVSAKNPSFGIRLNGTNDHPLFQGFQLTDPLKVESKAKIDAVAAELATTGAGNATHATVRDPRLNLYPTFFDPSHGVVEKEWALGGINTGGCVACHSSAAINPMTGQPMDPATYSPKSVGFFDGQKDLMKNGMMQAADYDCEGPMLVGMFDNPAYGGNGDGKLSCIEPMAGMPPCGTDPAMDAYAAGYTSTGQTNGEVGVCKKFVADGLMKAFGVQNSTPGAAMDGIDFMMLMAIRGGATTADPEGCNPMLRLFGFGDGGSSTTMPPTGTGCAQSDYFSRAEIRLHFQKNLQQSKFSPVVANKVWMNAVTGAIEPVPTTLNRVFGVVSVGKNPSNPSHANKFDIGATCYNPMDGSTFACPDGGYINTTVSETQLLGYSPAYQNCLMSLVLNPGTCGDAPVAQIAMGIDPVNPLKVNFDASSSTNADSYTWTFLSTDGITVLGTATGISATYTYAAPGDYPVTLKVTGPSGPDDTATSLATLSQNVVAKMAYQLVSDRTVSFDGTPSQNETTYAWNFGDGVGTSTLDKPSYTYAASGTYVVTLTVTDGNGNSNTTSGQVTVDKLKPVAKIMMQLDPSDPRKVNFDGTASLYEYSYSWDFGDLSPADTNGITSHTYAPGTYYPKLTVTGVTGLSNTATTRVVIK